MKLLPFLAGVFLCIQATAKPPYTVPDDLQTANLRGEVKSVRESNYDLLKDRGYSPERLPPVDTRTFMLYNPQGFMTRCESYTETDERPHTIDIYRYDSTGRRMLYATSETTADHAVQTTQYTYDSLGRLTEENSFPFGMKTLYTHDKDGYPVRSVTGGSQTLYRYDCRGRIRKEITRPLPRPRQKVRDRQEDRPVKKAPRKRHQIDTKQAKKSYAYRKGRLWREKPDKTQKLQYDAHGNPVCITNLVRIFDNPKKPGKPRRKIARVFASYEYDAHGNWIKRTQTYEGKATRITLREIEYR